MIDRLCLFLFVALLMIPNPAQGSRSLLREGLGSTFHGLHNVQTIAPVATLTTEHLREIRSTGGLYNEPHVEIFQTKHFLDEAGDLPVLVLPKPIRDPHSRALLRALKTHLTSYYDTFLVEQFKAASKRLLRSTSSENGGSTMADMLRSTHKYCGTRMLVMTSDIAGSSWNEGEKGLPQEDELPSNIIFVKINLETAAKLNIVRTITPEYNLIPKLLYFNKGFLLGSQLYDPAWEEPETLPKNELFIPHEIRRFYRHGSISSSLPTLTHMYKVDETGFVDNFGRPFGIYSGSKFKGDMGRGFIVPDLIGGNPKETRYRVMFEQLSGDYVSYYHERTVGGSSKRKV